MRHETPIPDIDRLNRLTQSLRLWVLELVAYVGAMLGLDCRKALRARMPLHAHWRALFDDLDRAIAAMLKRFRRARVRRRLVAFAPCAEAVMCVAWACAPDGADTS